MAAAERSPNGPLDGTSRAGGDLSPSRVLKLGGPAAGRVAPQGTRMKRTLMGKAALALVVAASLAACQQRQEEPEPAPAAAPDVNVTTPPDVNVTTPPGDVNLNPPDVNINPPDVNVNPPPREGSTTRESTTVDVPGVGSTTTTTTTEKR